MLLDSLLRGLLRRDARLCHSRGRESLLIASKTRDSGRRHDGLEDAANPGARYGATQGDWGGVGAGHLKALAGESSALAQSPTS